MVEVVNTVNKDTKPAAQKQAHDQSDTGKMYAARRKVYPKSVSGKFRRMKSIIAFIALAVFFITPWLRWDRGPGMPDQAVLIDLAHRRFYIFWIEIWPQEFYYVAALLIMAGIGLFILTAMFGRAWCGYGCWQTVWTDLFMHVDRLIEGDRNAQMRLDKAPWTAQKIAKRVIKYAIWAIIAYGTSLTFTLYFADAPTLVKQIFTGQAPSVAYSTIAIMGTITLVFAGFMREQVCIYMCPWPRIQGAMVDEDTLMVTYNDWRGEPRGSKRDHKKHPEISYGDCIDCGLCHAVCPTGIDIRDGQQLACITCALCIDACDSVMEKIGKPHGLISYSNLSTYNDHTTGKDVNFTWRSFIRPRTLVYLTVWTLIATALFLHLTFRDRLQINIVHDRNPLYTQLSNGELRNGYTVRLLNMQLEPRIFRIRISGLPGAKMTINGIDKPPAEVFEVPVAGNKARALKIYVTADPDKLKPDENELTFSIEALGKDGSVAEKTQKTTVFAVPRK